MKKVVVFESMREAYGIDDLREPMTVGQLRSMLEDLDDDVAVVVAHDNEYTYGSLTKWATLRTEQPGEYGPEYSTEDVIYAR